MPPKIKFKKIDREYTFNKGPCKYDRKNDTDKGQIRQRSQLA